MTDPRVVQEIIRQGRRSRRPRRYTNTAFRTGIVESGLENLQGGDADSYGFRQQRESIYGRQSLRRQVRNLFREFAQHDRGQTRGQLAADVQRPAAQYRGRYAAPGVKAQARQLTRHAFGAALPSRAGIGGGAVLTPGTPDRVQLARRSLFDQGGYAQAQRRAFLAERLGGNRNSILFRSGLLSTTAPNPADFTSSRLTSKIIRGRNPDLRISGSQDLGGMPSGQVGSAVKAARKRLGVQEVGSSNRGVKVDKWQRRFGMVGQPWCGIFAGVVLQKAGVRGVDSSIASVSTIEVNARAGRGPFRGWASPAHAKAGDLLVTRKGEHVAFVERVEKDGTIVAIGGNQTGGVTRVRWAPGSVYGVAKVRYRRR